MTRADFEQFLTRNVTGHYGGAPMVFADPPWTIEPCTCGDVNCRGWRVLHASQGGVMPTGSSMLCGCGRFMRVKRNSVTVEELLETGEPYKLWDADLWECVECGVEVISGFGQRPIAEHYQPTYAAQRERLANNPITAPIYPGRCRG